MTDKLNADFLNADSYLKHTTLLNLFALILCLSLALAVRLPDLTTFITADEARSWFGRSIIFLDALSRGDWANTAPGSEIPYLENLSLSPAPGVTTMWLGATGIWFKYLLDNNGQSLSQYLQTIPFDPLDPAMLFWLRLPGVLVATVAVGLTFWWGRPLLGLSGATLAALLLALDPFHVALSRVLGHDALVATFMWLALLASLNVISRNNSPHPQPLSYVGEGSQKHPLPLGEGQGEGKLPMGEGRGEGKWGLLICSAICAALAVLSKYPALFMVAFIIISLFMVRVWQLRQITPRQPALIRLTQEIALWLITFTLTLIILWPALWQHPLAIPLTILQDAAHASGNPHQKGSFFLGQPVPDPGALFYPLVLLFRTTPIIMLGLILGLVSLFNHSHQVTSSHLMTKSPRPYLGQTAYLISFILLYTLLVTSGGKKQDRYLLPIFPALDFLAAVGYIQFIRRLPRPRYTEQEDKLECKPSGLLAYCGANLTVCTPEKFNWWPHAVIPATLSLMIALQLIFILPTHPYYFSYYNPMFGGAPVAAQLMQVGWGEGLNEAANYLNNIPDIKNRKAVSWYSTTFEPYFQGQTIYKIDEAKISRDPKPGLAADYVIIYINQLQRRLPSDGALAYFQQEKPLHTVILNGLDYAWIYPAPHVRHIISQKSRLVGQAELLGFDILPARTLRLYWEWQGKSPDEPINLSLIDQQGDTKGIGKLTISNEITVTKQDGAIMTSDYAITIFPDSPPSDYFLKVWIDRPATNERVGDFPLNLPDNLILLSELTTP